MLNRYRISALLLLAAMLLCLSPAYAHPGRTDINGGHTNRSTGEYHYHHGESAHQHPNGVCPYGASAQPTQPISYSNAAQSNSRAVSTSTNKSSVSRPDSRAVSTSTNKSSVSRPDFGPIVFVAFLVLALSIYFLTVMQKRKKEELLTQRNAYVDALLSGFRASIADLRDDPFWNHLSTSEKVQCNKDIMNVIDRGKSLLKDKSSPPSMYTSQGAQYAKLITDTKKKLAICLFDTTKVQNALLPPGIVLDKDNLPIGIDHIYYVSSSYSPCYHLKKCRYALKPANCLALYEKKLRPCNYCHPPEVDYSWLAQYHAVIKRKKELGID